MLPHQIKNKTIIIAPLDWGLGHASRCIPLIRQFLDQNCKLIFAGVDVQIALVKKDFPALIFERIKGYEVSLDATKSTYLQMFSQFNKLKKIAREEEKIAKQLAIKYQADIILSDNRYGFRSSETKNIFISHQLSPQLPYLKTLVQKKIGRFVNQFDFCWLPDDPVRPICGELTQANLSIPVEKIGFLSRFKKVEVDESLDYLVIVSGPEPERSRFQNECLQLLSNSKQSFRIVTPMATHGESFVVNPSTAQLEQLIASAKCIISRAGYTTIMEMISLDKKALLIPTKGQYEQEYLAKIVDVPNIEFTTKRRLNELLSSESILV